jgi:hypothetical protein
MHWWEECIVSTSWMELLQMSVRSVLSRMQFTSAVFGFHMWMSFTAGYGVSWLPPVTVLEYISFFRSHNTCCIYLSVHIVGEYIFRIVIFSCWIDSFIFRYEPSLSVCTAFYLNYIYLTETWLYLLFEDSVCMKHIP